MAEAIGAQAITRPVAAGAGRPWLRFVVTVAATVAALKALLAAGPPAWRVFASLDQLTAAAVASLVELSGLAVEQTGTVLSHPAGFAYEIYYPCSGVEMVVVLLAGLQALPAPRGGRGRPALWGVVLLLALNLVRLAHLFHIGVADPESFDFMHKTVWQSVMLIPVAATWLWALSHRRRVRSGEAL